MIHRPDNLTAFTFVTLATLRAAQLMRGCIPLIAAGTQKATTIAQEEVAQGKIVDISPPRVHGSVGPAA